MVLQRILRMILNGAILTLTSTVKTKLKMTAVMAVRVKTILLMSMAMALTKMELMIMLTLWHNGVMMMGLMTVKCQRCDVRAIVMVGIMMVICTLMREDVITV